jgi:hexosaminidase
LKDEHELQSYFIQRMEKYLNSKGRILLGWDEILEGGLAPNAMVMSWRGEQGGIDAAKQNHNVIMTPSSHVYLDFSQTKNEDSVVIGGFTPVDKIYNYEPVPKELNAEQAKFVLGAQGNLWTEYIKYPSKVEYHIFPRISALSEVLWSPKEKRNWSDFEKRLMTQFKRYDLWKANYSRAYFDLKATILPGPGNKGLIWKLENSLKGGQVQLKTTSGAAQTYKTPVSITRDMTYQASLWKDGKQFGSSLIQSFHFNKATGRKATITKKPNEKYPGQPGAFSLVNGVYSEKGLSYPDWLGWIGDDIEATIDLGSVQTVDSVRMHTLNQNGSWIYLPEYVEVFTSVDGKKFVAAGRSSEFVNDVLTMGWITVRFPQQKTRYIKLFAKNYGRIPEGKPGGGNLAWVFADEVQVF